MREGLRVSDQLQLSFFPGPIGAPHFLEVVELTHIGLENMDDRVVGIEKDPVAMGQAFDPGRRKSGGLATLDDSVRDGADMDAGAPGGHDHEVGKGRLAAQVDRYDVFRLGVFQACQNRLCE